MRALEIREALPSDVALLAAMNKRLIEDEEHPNPMTARELTERMAAWLQGEYMAYLALVNGTVVAYCLYRDDGEHYYMRQLYVGRGYRRQGLATRLLDWMYRHVWTDKKVRLDVLSHNTRAIAFYKHYGFQVGCLRMEK